MKKIPVIILILCIPFTHCSKRASTEPMEVTSAYLRDKIHGGIIGQFFGNLNGLKHENKYMDEPGNVTVYTPDLSGGAFTDDDTDIEFVYIQSADPVRNDEVMAGMPVGTVVVNATGMGKDTPGSPVTDAGLFPRDGIAWEINYRGELDFWHQAMAQQESRRVFVEDGWLYFLHGWTQVIAEVLHIEIDEERFARLSEVAEELRPPLVYKPRSI